MEGKEGVVGIDGDLVTGQRRFLSKGHGIWGGRGQ